MPRPPHTIGRTWAWQLRLTALGIAGVCGVLAAAVFVAFPRAAESRLTLDQVAANPVKQTGFTRTVRLDGQPLGEGSREPVLNFTVASGRFDLGDADRAWLVRGAALDLYDPESRSWYRSPFAAASDRAVPLEGGVATLVEVDEEPIDYQSTVTMRDARQRNVFTIVPLPSREPGPGPVVTRFLAEGGDSLTFSPVDQQLGTPASGLGSPVYRLRWPAAGPRTRVPGVDELPADRLPLHRPWDDAERRGDPAAGQGDAEGYARQWLPQHDRVRRYALRIAQQAGLDRDPAQRHGGDDLAIAAALAEHLRTTYTYTLDNPPGRAGQDPVVSFLFDHRRGHCELFAAGLVALCRSLNIPARLVTGFMAVEYNGIGGYYVVRPTQAHAWAEVDGGPGVGWRTLDATPARAGRGRAPRRRRRVVGPAFALRAHRVRVDRLGGGLRPEDAEGGDAQRRGERGQRRIPAAAPSSRRLPSGSARSPATSASTRWATGRWR